MKSSPGQMTIDFDYDDRAARLAVEIGIILAPIVPPGVSREQLKELAARLATMASERLKKDVEPADSIDCRICGVDTKKDERARVVVCVRCALEGRTPGCKG